MTTPTKQLKLFLLDKRVVDISAEVKQRLKHELPQKVSNADYTTRKREIELEIREDIAFELQIIELFY